VGEPPGTVFAASVVSGVSAILALLFPPLGWIFAVVYAIAAVALYRLQVWAYWVLLLVSGVGWIVRAAQGHFDVIGTGVVIIVLLLTPSARAVFGVGRYSASGESRDSGW